MLKFISRKIKKSEYYVNFNQRNRDEWAKKIASQIPKGSKVLDIGAGSCRYKELFQHCKYFTQDFCQAEGGTDGNFKYGRIDYVSDITEIPVTDESFDIILCTEVLEHVPEPIKAIKEFSRILRKGGRLYLTAPLGCGLHMMPYHYYGGFTPSFYKKYFEKYGIKLISIEPNGGLLKHFLQESNRVGGQVLKYKRYTRFNIRRIIIKYLFQVLIPIYLYDMDNELFIEDFTVGYHVIGEKGWLIK